MRISVPNSVLRYVLDKGHVLEFCSYPFLFPKKVTTGNPPKKYSRETGTGTYTHLGNLIGRKPNAPVPIHIIKTPLW